MHPHKRHMAAILMAAASLVGVTGHTADPIITYHDLSAKIAKPNAPKSVADEIGKQLGNANIPAGLDVLYQAHLAVYDTTPEPKQRLTRLFDVQDNPILAKTSIESPINAATSAAMKDADPAVLRALLLECHAAAPGDPRFPRYFIAAFGLDDTATAAKMVDACAAANPEAAFSLRLDMIGLISRADVPKTDALPLLAEVRKTLDSPGFIVDKPVLGPQGLRVYTKGMVDAGKRDEAAAYALSIIRQHPSQIRYLVPTILQVGNKQHLTDAVPVLYDAVASLLVDGNACYEEHELLAAVLLKLQRYDEALHEAKILLAYSPRYQETVDILVAGFKGLDGHLGRLNALLAYHKFGAAGEDKKPGTADDLSDPLAGLARSADPIRAKSFAGLDKKISIVSPDKRADRAVAFLLQENPEAAFDEWLAAFAYCPMVDTSIQSAANGLSDFVLRSTRNALWAQQIVEFRTYGAAGPDGVVKTEDDIVDPMPLVRKQLAASYAK